MFNYKFVFTILAMAMFNFGVSTLLANQVELAATFMAVGTLLILTEVAVIVFAKQPLLVQIVQWFFEVSVFCFAMAYTTISNHLKEGVYLLVTGLVAFVIFVVLVLCVEMAKMDKTSSN